MTYPSDPGAAYDYTTWATDHPSDPLPGAEVADDFADHRTAINEVIAFQKLVQRSDGRLQNGSVRPETLSSGTLALIGDFSFEGAWLTATAYAVNDIVTEASKTYVCLVAHTSGTFSTDLAASKWAQIDGDNASLSGNNTWTGVQEFDGVVNFDAAVDFDGAEDHSGTETHSGTINLDGPVDIDGAVDISTVVTMSGSGVINERQGTTIPSVAGITDIGAATGNYVVVSGTNTITGLGTIQAGTRRIVEFSGALVLTHNATSLILPTNANITTAAGDVATFVSEGSGNWRCAGYMRASGAPVLNLAATSGVGTTFLTSGDITVGTAGSWTNVVSTGAIGAAGQVWLISARGTVDCTGGQSFITGGIYDGTNTLKTAEAVNPAANQNCGLALDVVVTLSGATTFTLRGTASAANSRFIKSATNVALDKATSITAVRLA